MEFSQAFTKLLGHEGGYVDRAVHVSADVILSALNEAVLHRSHQASSIFIPPNNSRSYGCNVPGCSRPAYARGFCNAHYIRARKGLSLDAPVRARKLYGVCAVCGEPSGTKGGWGMCQTHYRRSRYEVLKDAAVSAFGGKCMACGGVFHRSVFDFHHHKDKEDSPSRMFLNSSLKSLAQELSKCKLLCANCHRLEHHYEL